MTLHTPQLDHYQQRIAGIHRELDIPRDYDRRGLPLFREATELVDADCHRHTGEQFKLTPEALQAWQRMKAAAAAEGIEFFMTAGFRSPEYQAELIRQAVRQGYRFPEVLNYILAPGYSEHHTGRAIDLVSAESDGVPFPELYEQTSGFLWLERRADEFGFSMTYPRDNKFGAIYEPWHWVYSPSET